MASITRSTRETLSKKTPPTTPIAGSRKSERLEKKTSTPPSPAAPAKMNSPKKNKNEKSAVVVASPLRRSERMNKIISSPASSPTSSPSKFSNLKSSTSTPKKKRKFVEEKEVSEEEELDFGRSSKVKKRLDALVYRAGFSKAEEDCLEESNKMDKSTQEGVNSGGGKIPEDMAPSEDAKAKEVTAESRLSEPVKEFLEDNVTNDTRNETSEAHEIDQSDCCGEETSHMLRAEFGLNGPVKEISENNATLGLLGPSKGTYNQTSDASGRNQSDCHVEETSQMLESRMNGPVKELSENNGTLVSSAPSNATDNETSVALECDQSDNHKEEKSHMLLSRSCGLNENLIRSCVGNDNGEKLISKRKATMIGMLSDVSTTLVDVENCNLIANAEPSGLCDNNMGSNGSCSKRIRRISLSDVQSNQRNNVDQLSSQSEDVKLSTESEEERPQASVEHIRKQQRSLHLSLKPKIAKLCEILNLPDNVKNMVDNCLEYIMNNRQICTEPVTLLQAFQLSLCWIAASLLQYKFDFEASVKLAKRHLNFTCKKDVVNEIYTRLWELKEEILFHAGNPLVTDSPKASEPSNRVYSCTEMPPEVELAKSKSTREIQKCENQLGKVLQMQQGESQKLKADIEKEKVDFLRSYQIKREAIQHCSPSDVMRRERFKFSKNEYSKEYEELKRQHEKRLKDLKAMQVEAKRKSEESRGWGESLPDASKELETRIKDMKTCDQAESQDGPKNVACMSDHLAEGKNFDNIFEAITRAGTGVGFSKSPDTNSLVVVSCSSSVEQTRIGKHVGAKELGSMASEDDPVSRNKSHSINEIDYGSQGNIITQSSDSRETCSGGAAKSADDDGKGCGNFSCESHNDFGQDNAAVVLLSSNGEISDRGTSDVPYGEVALLMSKKGISNDDQEVPSSSQGKLDRTILRKPDCGLSVEFVEGFRDEVKNNASSNSQSSVEHIPNCDYAVQIHEVVSNDSNDGETPKLPPSDERPGGVAINNSILDKELSRPCGTASPNDGSDADATTIILNQDPLEKQNPDGASSSIPAEQITVEMSESGHEGISLSVSDRESPAGMPSTVRCRDHPENISPLDPSSMDQISDGASLLDGNLLSRSCGTSSSSIGLAIAPLNPPSLQQPDKVSLSIPTDQIPVIVPETSPEVAECQLTDTVMLDRNTTSNQQEGVQRTMTESTSTQEAPVSRPSGHTEPPGQLQPLSSVQSPDEPDTARETQNSLVSGLVCTVPANHSNHVSLVVEPPVQVHRLTFEDLSSNRDLPSLPSATGIEHQQTNEDTHSSQIAEASIEVPNQAVEQCASDLEPDSQSHDVVHPSSNLDKNSPMPVGVRTQPSETRNLSTTSDINNQPFQTATQSASRNAPPIFHDPLKNEMEKIRKLANDNFKNHEDKKLQFQSDYEKEFEELRMKYEVKLHDTEVKFQQQRKELDTQFKTVLVNKALADAFQYKCLDYKASSTSGMHQDPSFAHQLFQHISQQLSTWPPPVADSSSSGPPAASLQSSYTSSSQTAVPPPPWPCATTSSQTLVPPPPRPHTTGKSQPVVPPLPRPHATSRSQPVVPPPQRPHTTSRSHPVVPPPQRPHKTSRSHPVVPPPQRPHMTSRSHPVVPPPPQPTYNTWAIFSDVVRLPHNNSIPPLGNFQAGEDIRSPAPHLQPYRASTSVPPSTNSPAPHLQPRRPSLSVPASTNLCTDPPAMPSPPASVNIPLNPPPFSRQHPTLLSRTKSTNQSEPHKVLQPTSAGGLPTPNLTGSDSLMDANIQSGINLPNVLPQLSELAKLNILKVGTSSSRPASSPLQGTPSDVLCLSDDE